MTETPSTIPALDSKPVHRSCMTSSQILETTFPELRWIVPGIVCEGLSIFAARPKTGKTWMMFDVALAVSGGSRVLGRWTEPGSVLFLSLEDNLRRVQDRLKRLNAKPSDNLTFETRRFRADSGGLDYIRKWLESNRDKARLIVVDTWGRFKPLPRKGAQMYDADTDAAAPLQALANEHRVGIVVVHHVRKAVADDFVDTVSGSLGLAGVCDSVLVLERERHQLDAVLHVTGRDVPESETTLRFNPETFLWEVSDLPVAAVGVTAEQDSVIQLLRRFPNGLGLKQIADGLGKQPQAMHNRLVRMKELGIIEQRGRRAAYRLRRPELFETSSNNV